MIWQDGERLADATTRSMHPVSRTFDSGVTDNLIYQKKIPLWCTFSSGGTLNGRAWVDESPIGQRTKSIAADWML